MNSSISSKLSLYDILAMLIPGALIIYWINLVFYDNYLTKVQIAPLIFGILFSAGSYLVGIIYCKMIEHLWNKFFKGFKKKKAVTRKSFNSNIFIKFRRFLRKHCKHILAIFLVVFLLSSLFCLIFFNSNKEKMITIILFTLVISFFAVSVLGLDKRCLFVRDICKLLARNNSVMIRRVYYNIQKKLIYIPFPPPKNYIYYGKLGSVDHYYLVYAFVAKNTYRNVVHTLESQFAFLRSMFGVILLFLCSLAIKHFRQTIITLLDECHVYCIVLSLFFILIAIPFVMAYIQKKIYETVWEDYEYLSRVV